MEKIILAISILGLAVMGIYLLALKLVERGKHAGNEKGYDLSWLIFFSVLIPELVAGYYFSINGYFMGDAIARVANAFFVLHIEPAHLASIGFVWNPLPSLLELPFMVLAPVYKPIAASLVAGVIVTSFFAAGTAVLLYKNFRHFNVSQVASVIMIALYAFNPFIFIYGFNGMSEVMFIFFIVLSITELVRWFDDENWLHLVWIGIALALAFLTRYEAIPFAFAIFLVVAFLMIRKKRQNGNAKTIWGFFEGTSIVIFLPIAASIVIWILLNWVIMDDPLYFLTSEYSNATQSEENLPTAIRTIVGDFWGILVFVVKKAFVFLPFTIAVLIIRYLKKQLISWETLMFLMLVISIPCFQYLMLFMGSSFGWLRFFMYPLPIAMAWLPYEFKKENTLKPISDKIMVIICCAALILSSGLTSIYLNNPDIASEEHNAFITGDPEVKAQREIAEYIDMNQIDGIFLMDSFRTFYVILALDSTEDVITSCSYVFNDAVRNPWEFDVKYILTVTTDGLGSSDALNSYYPDLFENGADWCTLVKDFGNYKLYEVIY
jgi:hypothetical protein